MSIPNSSDDSDASPFPAKTVVGALVTAWLVLLVIAVSNWSKIGSLGQLGDTFGLLNCLFSAGAFALLIYTANLQRRELNLQRIEMRDSRAELKGQKDQLRHQNELTVLSGRIALLPIIIENENRGLCSLSTYFKKLYEGGNLSAADWRAQAELTQPMIAHLQITLNMLRNRGLGPREYEQEYDQLNADIKIYTIGISRMTRLAQLNDELEGLRGALSEKSAALLMD